MEIYIPSELDNETYLKYEKIIKINNISTIYLIKDKYDIKENTYIGDDTSKIYVTKSLTPLWAMFIPLMISVSSKKDDNKIE